MTIITRSRAGNFSIIPNSVSEDDRLSFEARGVLCYLLAKPDNWQIRIDDLRRSGGIGRDRAYKIIKELRDTGYLKVTINRGANGQITGQDYVIYDVAEVKEKVFSSDLPDTDLPDTDLPDTDLPDTDLPDTDLPDTDLPESGKHGHIIRTKNIINTHLSVSSLRSETESSVCSQASQTDILSNAQARENPEIEKHGQKTQNSSENQTEKAQSEKQSPAQEPKQQRQTQANRLDDLGRRAFQVAPPVAGRGGVRHDVAVARGGNIAAKNGTVNQKNDFKTRGAASRLLDDVECQTDQQNASASHNEANKSNFKAGNRRINYSDDFEGVWKLYPTTPNMSKKETFDQWRKIDDEDRKAVAQAIPEYQKFLKSKPDHPVIHFCRFISKRRFDGFQPHEGSNAPEHKTQKPKSWLYDDPTSFSEVQWEKILYVARTDSMWWRSWGAMPGEEGCLVPKHLLHRDDGWLWKYEDEIEAAT